VRVSGAGGYEPLWSADGRELFYRQGDAMMVVAVETAAEFSFAAPRMLSRVRTFSVRRLAPAPMTSRATAAS